MDNTKKHITKEWLEAFPYLNSYAQNKFYKTIGLFVAGIELIKLPRVNNYRPHFVLYYLFKNNVSECLKTPAFLCEFYNSKGNQINLPYDDKFKQYKIAQDIIKRNLVVNLNEEIVQYKHFEQLMDYYLYEHNDFFFKNHSGNRASLFELKLYTALYAGDEIHIQNVINAIQNESINWNMQMFEMWYGKFDKWFQGLYAAISNRDNFLKQIEVNKQNKKMALLHNSKLIM